MCFLLIILSIGDHGTKKKKVMEIVEPLELGRKRRRRWSYIGKSKYRVKEDL